MTLGQLVGMTGEQGRKRVSVARKEATSGDLVTPPGPYAARWSDPVPGGVITLSCELCPNGKLPKP